MGCLTYNTPFAKSLSGGGGATAVDDEEAGDEEAGDEEAGDIWREKEKERKIEREREKEKKRDNQMIYMK